jgi:hypothetical protein
VIRPITAVLLSALTVGLVGCATFLPPGAEPAGGGGAAGGGPGRDGPEPPPPVTVRTKTTALDLEAWTWCYLRGCADGPQPETPPDIGDASEVEVRFPLEGWTFEATFVPVGVACPRRHVLPAEQLTGVTHLVRPAGPADTYDVTLFGRGDGDLFVTFRWTTASDGPMPIPSARLAILADHDGEVDSYGVELELTNLASTPESAVAGVTVTAADGNALTFDASRAEGCWPDGTVYWDGPAEAGLEAAQLGPAPFTYDVVVTLDGMRYAAEATWPADQIVGNEPSVNLSFAPQLPALGDD